MNNTGKCPSCGKTVVDAKVEYIEVQAGFSGGWKGFSYSCSSCHAVLGVQVNPLLLNVDLIQHLKSEK
jgi:hypothetical protein